MSQKEQELPVESTLASLPSSPEGDFPSQIRAILEDRKAKIPILVALDDDPTGTQTCHDVNVLTVWDREILAEEFRQTPHGGGFFILTNSRALHPPQASDLIAEICLNLKAAATDANVDFEVVLRGDSTLRGHFPLEPEAVEASLGKTDIWILCPFFLQGGRYTVHDVHYVAEDNKLVPAGQTPFAQDASFGYRSSNLRSWIVEKSRGSIAQENISSLSIKTIRTGGATAVEQQLMRTSSGAVVILNAAATSDVDIAILGILAAAQQGRKLLFRTGAAFVSSRLAITPIPPLSAKELSITSGTGALVIAGSYVPKTTSQLEALRELAGDTLTTIILDVRKLLHDQDGESEIRKAVAMAEKDIKQGQDVLIMTSRELLTGSNETESLNIGARIAKSLVSFLVQLDTRPRYIVAKGGITSSDMATKGLRMRRASIVGQAAPGVPTWRCDEPSSKWPGIPYVVFPGNVGSREAIYDLLEKWRSNS